MRLQITQQVNQLVGIDKTKKLDFATGGDVETESPNLRKNFVTGTVQVPDGDPILMPVDYRPVGKDHEDKVWLLVARPIIWIEEEVKEIRKGGGNFSPQSIWKSDLSKEEIPPAPENRLPLNDDVKEILQAVITDVLTNPALKDVREFYGTAKDKTLVLDDGPKLGWPKDFNPGLHDYSQLRLPLDPFGNQHRVLGICLNKFGVKPEKDDPLHSPIRVGLYNVGGCANGGVIGSCWVSYTPKRIGKHWTVEFDSLLDP